MSCTRESIIKVAKDWLGFNENDGTHKYIIDVYNSHKPLARNYKVKYDDAWCATFVSAVAIKAGATDIIPTECGCGEMIKLFQKLGTWQEKDEYSPKQGDIIFYDWDDSGKGDNTGWSDHVGIVENVNGTKITVIEGNKDNQVKRVYRTVNGKYIRGYGVPKYQEKQEVVKKTATDSAKSFDTSLKGSFVTTTALYMRNGAGTLKKKMCVMDKGTVVKCYGYYTEKSRKWLYVTFQKNNVQYTGFASDKYLKRL